MQFRKQGFIALARKLVKLREKYVCCILLRQSACFSADNTSLGFIALGFTTLHSIEAFESALSYYHMILCCGGNMHSTI